MPNFLTSRVGSPARPNIGGASKISKILLGISALCVLLLILTPPSLFKHQAHAQATGSWTAGKSMPTARVGAAAGVIGGKFYVVGGEQAAGPTAVVEIYDPATDSWSTGASMATPRGFAVAGVIDGKLYIAGGRLPTDAGLQTLEVYDPVLNTWATKASMPPFTGRQRAMGAAIGEKLYVAGGINVATVFNTLEIYNSATDSWSSGAGLPQHRAGGGAAVIGGKLHVVSATQAGCVFDGGHLVYDPTANSWSPRASLPNPRDELTNQVAVMNGLIHVAGGRLSCAGPITDLMHIYDPATNTWASGPPMPTKRAAAAAGVIGSRLYVVGGTNEVGVVLNTMDVYSVAIIVAIDIKPGSFPNSINLGSSGTVPVAIFSSPTFDATQVDPLTVTLAGAAVALRGKGTPMASFVDVNSDGLLDLVVHVSTEALQLSETDTEAVLEGKTFGGLSIRGVDTVRIVP